MIRVIVAFCLVFISQFACAAALWEVSHGEQKFWLGASLSGLKKAAYPLPPEFDDAFRRADTLYVERDINAVSAPDFAARAMQASVYRDGRNLKSVLSADNWRALETHAQSRGVPTFSLLMFKPAFAGFTLMAVETRRLDLGNGVDAHYFFRAKENQKPVVALETVEQQIQLLYKINEADPNILIKTLIDELTNLPDSLDTATRAWKAGDLDKLDDLRGKKMRAQTPALYQELVVDRSKAWLPQFKTLLTTAEVELVLVDAVHFSGPDNLLQLLTAQGYRVTPYRL